MRMATMATTALGAISSMTRTVSATVSRVSPGPPKRSEWQKSMPARLQADEAARSSSTVKLLPRRASMASLALSVPKSTAMQPASASRSKSEGSFITG